MINKLKAKNIEIVKKYIDYFFKLKENYYKRRQNLFFIAFEGSDKVGKTTLLMDIYNKLKEANYNNSFSNIVLMRTKDKVDTNKFGLPITLFYEILSNRSLNTYDIINKYNAIKDNYQDFFMVVLYDRYIESTLVYQILYYLENGLLNISEADILSMINNLFISANYLIPDLTIGIIRDTNIFNTEYDEVQEFYDTKIVDSLYEIIFETKSEYNKHKNLVTYTTHIYNNKERNDFINDIIFRIFEYAKKQN